MPSPKLLIDAERDVHRALLAARHLGAEAAYGLATAENILAEVRHFALGVADSKVVRSDDAGRMLSAILGFKVEVLGTRTGLNELEGYARLPR